MVFPKTLSIATEIFLTGSGNVMVKFPVVGLGNSISLSFNVTELMPVPLAYSA
jgi:hypothetical protein